MTTHPVPEIPEIPEPPAAAVKATPVSTRGRFGRWHLKAAGEGEEESWLLTYLDVMTLLLVMMVVMLAFAKPASEDAGQGDGSGGPAAPRAQAPLNLRPQLNQLVAPREKDPLAGLPPQEHVGVFAQRALALEHVGQLQACGEILAAVVVTEVLW